MKQKKFSSLGISQYLKPLAKDYIEKWISIKNHDEFVKLVYFVIRDLHTAIKNFECPVNNQSIFMQGKQPVDREVVRLDHLMSEAKRQTRA